MKNGHRAPAGDDAVAVPPGLPEGPPPGLWCDLVLTGGVASGVVYPWAVLELARQFQFRQIGGTSVGAMAAALAAAAEFGRRNGYRQAFEPLRRAPEQLAEVLPGGMTRMLSLFQPLPQGQRLLKIFIAGVDAAYGNARQAGPAVRRGVVRAVLRAWLRAYAGPWLRGALIGAVAGAVLGGVMGALLGGIAAPGDWRALLPLWLGAGAGAVFGALILLWRATAADLKAGLIHNHYGLCAGAQADPTQARDRPGLTDWLHEGIQRSAGLTLEDPPLTFADLWRAPMEPGSPQRGGDASGERAIDLQMITTSVAHMRPYALPMLDSSSRLYFCPKELEPYFPAAVLEALRRAPAYVQRRPRDPSTENGAGLLALPGADLPIVVAARLSLSFPLLFSAVPLHAVDYEIHVDKPRKFARCHFSDGGLCSNFPIHLFDAALPTRPTFGLWLDERGRHERDYPDPAVWLPEHFSQGRGDAWNRFDDGGPRPPEGGPTAWQRLGDFLMAAALTAKDWGDRSAMRMPHVRHRVARLYLRPGEGALNIAMPRGRILQMAREYGVLAGRAFTQRYASTPGAPPTRDWDRQRWVRLRVMVPALKTLLRGFGVSSQGSSQATPADRLAERAGCDSEFLDPSHVPGQRATQAQPAPVRAWQDAVAAIATLERALDDPLLDLPLSPSPEPQPGLRIRPPV